MNKVLNLLVAGVLLVAGSFVSKAQPGGGGFPGGQGQFDPAQMATMRADMMKQTVNLTDDQYKKVVAMYKEETEAMMKAFQSGQPQPMDREAMQKQREEQNKKLKAILTDEQWKKWEEAMQNMMRGFGGPGGPGGPGGGRPPRQ